MRPYGPRPLPVAKAVAALARSLGEAHLRGEIPSLWRLNQLVAMAHAVLAEFRRTQTRNREEADEEAAPDEV